MNKKKEDLLDTLFIILVWILASCLVYITLFKLKYLLNHHFLTSAPKQIINFIET